VLSTASAITRQIKENELKKRTSREPAFYISFFSDCTFCGIYAGETICVNYILFFHSIILHSEAVEMESIYFGTSRNVDLIKTLVSRIHKQQFSNFAEFTIVARMLQLLH
jgi:hypothetical protein